MKIILVTGMSGSGKTTVCKELCERYGDKYNFVASFTDREMRESNEWGHTFVDTYEMNYILTRDDVIATTTIEENRYCTIARQFDKHKVNLYTVDSYGIKDTYEAFPQADIMTILISRTDVEVDCVRENRDVCVPSYTDVDFIITNNGAIDYPVGNIDTLVNLDLFNKPSHKKQTITNKLDYINEQERRLHSIRQSLQKQLWYINYPNYLKLVDYVNEKLKDDFDYEVVVTPDEGPEIYDEYLHFLLIGEHKKDATWVEMDALVRKMSEYAYTFCEKHDCEDISYRLHISERYIGYDDYE